MISANANVLKCVVLTEVITDLVNMYESRDFFASFCDKMQNHCKYQWKMHVSRSRAPTNQKMAVEAKCPVNCRTK